jgi:trigger factor
MIVIKPSAVFKDLTELANETGSDIDETAVFDSNFRFTVENIHRIVPAELNQELFDKMFGIGKVSSLEEARQFISDEMVKNYRKQSDIRFFNEVVEHLVNNTRVNLPDNFMKKWLVSNSEGKVKPEDVEQNYENYAKAIRWQLIEGKILRDNKISFTQEDVLNKLTDDFLGYMGISQADDNDDLRERARQVATGMLKNEKQVNEAYEELFNQALIKLFYDSFDVVVQELPLDEWVKQIGAPLA